MVSIFTTNLECNPKFRDKDGLSCDSYTKNKWCTESGDQGPAWGSDYPSIDEYYNVDGETPLVCPQCGCNKGMILVLIHQVLLMIIAKYCYKCFALNIHMK